MNMFARFDENPAMTLQDIKKTKPYGRTDAWMDNVKTVYPPQTKFAGGIITADMSHCHKNVQNIVSLSHCFEQLLYSCIFKLCKGTS